MKKIKRLINNIIDTIKIFIYSMLFIAFMVLIYSAMKIKIAYYYNSAICLEKRVIYSQNRMIKKIQEFIVKG